MATAYPDFIDGYQNLPLLVDNVSPIRSDDVNRLRNAIVSIERELGVQPSSTFGTVRARLDALEDLGGGGGGGALLDSKGDLLTHNDTEIVALNVGPDGYVLVASSDQPSGLRWGQGSGGTGEVVSLLSREIQDPDNREYFLTTEIPFSGRVESITTKSSAGTFLVDGYVNSSTHIGTASNTASTSEQSVAHTTANTFAVGNSISFVVSSATFLAQDLEVTFKLISTQSAGNFGEVNTGQNVGIGGVGPFKQKIANVLQFRNINAGSSKITVTSDTVNDEIDIDVTESALTHNNIGGTLSIAKGGTGQITASAAFNALSPTTTKGDIAVNTGATNIRLAVGADGYVLTASASEISGVKWSSVNATAAPYNASYLTLGLDSTLTNERVLVPGSGQLVATDAGVNASYILGLANTAVTPGSYTLSSITVDGYGRITSASTGSAAPVSASYLVLGSDGTLTNERTLVPGANQLILTDGGANAGAILGLASTAVTPGSYTIANITVDGYGRVTAASSGTELGANTALSNLTTTSVNRSFLPAIDDGYQIGSSTLRWADIFGSRSLRLSRDGYTAELSNTVYSNIANQHPVLILKRAEGSSSSPAEVSNGSIIASIDGYGFDSAEFALASSFVIAATEDWSPTNRGSSLNISTVRTGSGAATSSLFVSGTGDIGISTTSPIEKLHVVGDGYFAGFVRVSDTADSAPTAGAGALKWNGSEIQFSDGTSWAGIATGSTAVYKTADQSITSSVTLTDDSELSASVTGSQKYKFDINTFILNDGYQAGIRLSLGGTSTATSLKAQVFIYDDTYDDLIKMDRIITLDGYVTAELSDGYAYAKIEGTVEAATTGTFKLRWAQNVSNSSATRVQRNSHMILTRL